MTSLVTGATGFIGRHLLAQLAQDGQQVRALYRDEQKRRQYLVHGEEAIRGDVCDSGAVRAAVSGVEAIYHCAAAHSTCSADEIRLTNLASVECLLEAVRSAAPTARVVLLSSLNVLGNESFVSATEDAPRRATHDLHVDLKIAAEEEAERAIASGLNIFMLRPGLVYGQGDPHLAKLAGAVARGKFVFIGSRDNIVPLVHVSDLVQAMVLAANAPANTSRVFNITDGSATTIGELVSLLARAVGVPAPMRVLPAVVPRLAVTVFGLIGREGPITRGALRFLGASRHVDIGRARTQLGYEPRVQIEQGIAELADWLRGTFAAQSAA
jgi:nucleoside-diphosphate-sugar epimerase